MKAKNFSNLVLTVATLLAAGTSIAAPAGAAGCPASERVSGNMKQLVGTDSGFQAITLTFVGARPSEQDAGRAVRACLAANASESAQQAIVIVRHKPNADTAASDAGILLYDGATGRFEAVRWSPN